MLADDIYRLSHHDGTGKPRLHARAIELGCAAAILTELFSSRHIGVEEDKVTVLDRRPPGPVVDDYSIYHRFERRDNLPPTAQQPT